MIDRARTALLTLALMVSLVLSASLAPAPALAAVDASGAGVTVAITGVSPQVLGPGQDLTLTVTLTNDGPLPVAEPRVRVHVDASRRFISRSSLDLWREAGIDGGTGAAVLTEDLPAPLAPGETREVTLTLPAGSVGLRDAPTTWGPRGLAVAVVDRADPARPRLGLARTFLLWFPEQPVGATEVSVLVPVVGPPGHPLDTGWPAEVERETAPGGRLAELLAVTGDHPVVSWALDPALLGMASPAPEPAVSTSGASGESAEGPQAPERPGTASVGPDQPAGVSGDGARGPDRPATGSGAPVDGTPAEAPALQGWVQRLTDGVAGRDVLLLPYADADAAALAHAGAGPVWTEAVLRSREAAPSLSLPATQGVVWPARGLLDQATADLAAERDTSGGRPVAVADPSLLPPPDRLTWTPSGRTTVTTDAGPVTALVADARLSRALATGGTIGADRTEDLTGAAGATEPDGLGDASSLPPVLTPATAAQDLLAELAVITRERPNDPRHVLMTVARDWAPDAELAAAQLAALSAAPWVQPSPVSALLEMPDDGVDRGTLPALAVGPSEVTAPQLAAARRALRARAELAEMVPEPATLLAGAEDELLALTSVAWRRNPTGRAEALGATIARTAALRDAVQARPGSTLNVISTSVDLPVRVANGLDQPVTITVALEPGDARLVAEEERTVTVPARGEELVQIPVHGIQSADVPVTVVLSTTDGTVIDDSAVIEVRVRPEWEGIGTAVLAALLALGLVTGLVRTIRRGRTGRRAAPWTGSGPDTLSPEEQALAREQQAPTAEDPARQASTATASARQDGVAPPAETPVQERPAGTPREQQTTSDVPR